MHRRIFHFATVLLWLTLPLVALQYRQVWDQLPVHVATHFNAAGQANGWMSRDEALKFGVGFMAFLLVIFTALLLLATRKGVDAFSWALRGFCALVLGIMVEVNRGIVNYNLHGAALRPQAMLIAVPIAAILLIVIYIASRREPPLPSSGNMATELLAVETHSGGAWSLLILPALIGPVVAAFETVAVIRPSPLAKKFNALTPLNFTVVAPVKCPPLMLTEVPPAPEPGEKLSM